MTAAFLANRPLTRLRQPWVYSDVAFAERLDGVGIDYGMFAHCTFANVSFKGCKIADSRFIDCTFISCYFRKTEIRNSKFDGCKFVDCDFPQVRVQGTTFMFPKFKGCFIGFDEMRPNLPLGRGLRTARRGGLPRRRHPSGMASEDRSAGDDRGVRRGLARSLRNRVVDRPIPDSYWVEPRRFLAGEYPGSEVPDKAAVKVASLREAGVDFFLDLTEVVEDLLPYEHLVEGTGVTYQRFPVVDLTCPAHQEMSSILDTIDAALAGGRTVYLHCWGGIGRTGTVVGCYLVRHGRSGDAAVAQIAAWREGTPDGYKESPETPKQRDFVLGWSESVT